MLSCKTVGCSEKDVQHTPNPEGLDVYCGLCGEKMSEVVASE
jgi:hypothetical protein